MKRVAVYSLSHFSLLISNFLRGFKASLLIHVNHASCGIAEVGSAVDFRSRKEFLRDFEVTAFADATFDWGDEGGAVFQIGFGLIVGAHELV